MSPTTGRMVENSKMKKISNMIRQTLTALLFNTAVAIDGPPSWLWIYEPEKPKLLKDK